MLSFGCGSYLVVHGAWVRSSSQNDRRKVHAHPGMLRQSLDSSIFQTKTAAQCSVPHAQNSRLKKMIQHLIVILLWLIINIWLWLPRRATASVFSLKLSLIAFFFNPGPSLKLRKWCWEPWSRRTGVGRHGATRQLPYMNLSVVESFIVVFFGFLAGLSNYWFLDLCGFWSNHVFFENTFSPFAFSGLCAFTLIAIDCIVAAVPTLCYAVSWMVSS